MPLHAIERDLREIIATQDYSKRLTTSADSTTAGLATAINAVLADVETQRTEAQAKLSELEDARDDAQTTNRLLKKLKEQLHQRGLALDEALNKAAAANSAKSQFLANMSHEIRTPMNGILGMAELLNRSELSSKQASQVATIINSGRSLLTIINDILDFSKIESGKFELDCKPFDLFSCLKDIIELLRPGANRKGLTLVLELDERLPKNYIGDAGRIRQIIMNLAGNAVKFTEKGSVTLRLSGISTATESQLAIDIVDTGIGIPADKVSTVFEKFSQVDNSGTRRHEGTGLGLSICQSLLARMGSTIQVSSTLGEGSTFSFRLTLPVHDTKDEHAHSAASLEGREILLLGETELLVSVKAILADANCRIVEAKDTIGHRGAAIAVLAADTLDATLLSKARMLAEDACEVLLVVQNGQPGDARSAEDVGAAAYFTAPFEQDEILETLEHVTSQPRGTGSNGAIHGLITRHSLAEARVRVAAPEPAAPCTSGKRILVVDDSLVNQEIAAEFLSDLQCDVETANNGKMAVELARETEFDLILMDCQMPVMDGFRATHEIRSSRGGATRYNVPIIALTANAFESDREKCLASGMSDFISKPFLPDDFTNAVLRWLASDQQSADADARR